MYLFGRQVTLQGPFREMLGWATEVTQLVNEVSDVPVTLWGSSMGYPIGTMVWSARVESHAQLFAMTAGLQSNDAYLDLVDRGRQYIHTPGEDNLRRFVVAPEGEPPQVALLTTATAASGREADAMAWGADMAGYVSKLTGHAASFLVDSYGTFGQVTWIQGFEDVDELDAAQDTTSADEEYLNRVTKAGDLFVESSGHQALATRIV